MKNKLIVMALLGMMSLNASDKPARRKRAIGADCTLAQAEEAKRAEEIRRKKQEEVGRYFDKLSEDRFKQIGAALALAERAERAEQVRLEARR
jgi:hypothetical protein